MKKIIVVGFLLLFGKSFANENHEARLNLNLNLFKICDESTPFCLNMSRTINFGGVLLSLAPQNGRYVCDEEVCTSEDITHYRGIWSSVVENDGVRSIAVVSIDKRLFLGEESEEKTYVYYIVAEILGTNGVEAKLELRTRDLSKLNDINLEGPVKEIRQSRYQAGLRIGPARILSPVPMPNPCSRLNELCEVEVNLISGFLK